jgi:hypothetical protein
MVMGEMRQEEGRAMNESTWERCGASSGFAMVVLGAAATVFERTPVTAADFAANRTALLTQSMLFLAGAGISLWFVGCLRTYLSRAEGGSGRLAGIAFGAGIAWATLNMLAQAFQVGVASDPAGEAPVALLKTMTAVFTVANLPLVVMLVAVAVVSLRHNAFPAWLGWLSIAAAGAQTLLWVATVVESGPLASDGWLNFVLYPFFIVWLIPATVIMVRRAGQPRVAVADSPPALVRASARG